MQIICDLLANIFLMVAFRRKGVYCRPHVTNIILDFRLVCIVQRFLDKTHSWSRIRLCNFLLKTLCHNIPDMQFILYTVKINRFAHLFLRQSAADYRHWNIVAKAQPPPQTAFSCKYLDLNIFCVDAV